MNFMLSGLRSDQKGTQMNRGYLKLEFITKSYGYSLLMGKRSEVIWNELRKRTYRAIVHYCRSKWK